MAFHWTVMILIAVSVWYAYSRGFIPREERDLRRAIMMLHFDWSWVAMGVVALRIFWKARTAEPKTINDDARLILAHTLVAGALLALHVGAALWHHVIKKDETLQRMLPWG